MLCNFHDLLFVCRFFFQIFSKSTFKKNSFKKSIRVSNSLDQDQARHFVGPDLGPNCLQRLAGDDPSRQRIKSSSYDKIRRWQGKS